MRPQDEISQWLQENKIQREELEELFCQFSQARGATVRDDGEIHVFGAIGCACGDEMASNAQLKGFSEFIKDKKLQSL